MRHSDKEQRHVRTAIRFLRHHNPLPAPPQSASCATTIRFLRHRVSGWQPLTDALGVKADSLGKVLRGGRAVTASLAYSVARLTDVSINDLLAGALLSPRTYPHCEHPPDDFVDEETVVELAR